MAYDYLFSSYDGLSLTVSVYIVQYIYSAAYEGKEDQEARDVADHSTERDLQRPEHLERRHQVRRARDAQHVGDGEQHVRDDLRVVWLPVEPRCSATHITPLINHMNPHYEAHSDSIEFEFICAIQENSYVCMYVLPVNRDKWICQPRYPQDFLLRNTGLCGWIVFYECFKVLITHLHIFL